MGITEDASTRCVTVSTECLVSAELVVSKSGAEDYVVSSCNFASCLASSDCDAMTAHFASSGNGGDDDEGDDEDEDNDNMPSAFQAAMIGGIAAGAFVVVFGLAAFAYVKVFGKKSIPMATPVGFEHNIEMGDVYNPTHHSGEMRTPSA